MIAREARALRVGDKVVAPFSNSHRLAEIVRIEWPHFIVTARLESGEIREQRNRYRALRDLDDYRRAYGEPRGTEQ